MIKLFIEVIVVGIGVSIFGTFFSYLAMAISQKNLFVKFNHWETIIISEFLTGVVFHLLAEYSGINKWYCKNGNACLI